MTLLRNIVILTGAGISAESGIPTFRAADGLWHEHKIEEVASPQGFAANPALVHKFYNQRRQHLLTPEVKPNLAHFALAKLEREFQGQVMLITQNIDDLHERAGSRQLIHMHGELLKIRCTQCGMVTQITDSITEESICQQCKAPGSLRPDIVWFGETPMHMTDIEEALLAADLFVAIGTSGNVYPAAGFYQLAASAGAETLEINLESTGSNFGEVRIGSASQVVSQWVEELISDSGNIK